MGMNYTKTLRSFCLQNKGKILDSAELHKQYFEFVPYKTFLKVLNRLRDEGLLIAIDKGVWKITGDGEKIDAGDDDILSTYASVYNGMVVGYALYNSLGITAHKEEYIQIYTKRIPSRHKTIQNYKLTQAKHLLFTKEERDIITVLELIENRNSIIGGDPFMIANAIEERLKSYSDIVLREIVSNIHYQYSTVITLEHMLRDIGNADAACAETYRIYSMDA